jgi:hypothetical protein
MCDASLAIAGASAVFGAMGQYAQAKAQGQAQKSAAEYNAAVAAREQATQQQLAQSELAKGEADRTRILREGARKQGELRSLMGASGLAMDSGSNLSLLDESAEEIQYDATLAGRNAATAAWDRQVGAARAANDRAWASYQKQQAGNGRGALWARIGGTLLGDLGNGLYKYNQKKSLR